MLRKHFIKSSGAIVRTHMSQPSVRNFGFITSRLERFHEKNKDRRWYPHLGLMIPLLPFAAVFLMEKMDLKRKIEFVFPLANKEIQKPKSSNTLIIGAGPAGLVHALVACKYGPNHVILLTDRYEYTRNQVLVLQNEFFSSYSFESGFLKRLMGYKLFNELIKDKKLVRAEIYPNYYVIKTRVLEEVLFIELMKYTGHKLEVIYLNRDNPLLQSEINTESLLLKDSNSGSILRQIDYQHLIVANGAHSDIIPQIKANSGNPIQLQKLVIKNDGDINLLHNHYMVAVYDLPATSNAEQYEKLIAKGLTTKQPKIKELNQLGWKQDSLPEPRLFAVDGVLHVAAEAPAELKNDKEAIDKWARTVLKFYLPQSAIDSLQLPHHKTRYAKFEIDFKVMKQAGVLLEGPKEGSDYARMITVVGDAAKVGHYQAATGGNRLLYEGEALEQLYNYLSNPYEQYSWVMKTPATRKKKIEEGYQKYFDRLESFKNIENRNISFFANNRIRRENEAKDAKNPKPRQQSSSSFFYSARNDGEGSSASSVSNYSSGPYYDW